MTAMIIPFVGRQEIEAAGNLAALITHAQSYRFFHSPDAVDWFSNTWDLRPFFSKATSTPTGLVIHFTNFETTRRGNRAPEAIDMQEPFLSAGKALLVEHLRTSGDNSPTKMIAALRTVEKAFRDFEMHPDVTSLSPAILDRAQEIVVEKYQDSWSYGRFLERLAMNIVRPSQITNVPISWKTAIQYKAPVRNDRVNSEGARGRTDKLPSLQSIFDLASVFHESKHVSDQIITGWFALAMFAPNRVNEILGLPVACETEMDGIYGLSWRPEKSGDPLTKFAVTPENAEVAKIAIARLKAISDTSRTAHRWYEENPGQLYLPPGFEQLRGEPLSMWEAAQILGRSVPLPQGGRHDQALVRCGNTNDRSRMHPDGLGRVQGRLVTFESLEKFVIGELPASFPFIDPRNGLKGGDALFCLPDEIMRPGSEANLYIPRYLTYSQVKHELGSKPSGNTIFARNSLINPETDKPWRLNTHQPRHLLNTLAQSKHLSQELIAFWSGRKSVKQNDHYNHVPQESFIEAFLLMDEAAPSELNVVGPLADKVEERMRKESISRNTALKLEVGSTITTRFGLCRHDYSLMPCPKDKDCIRCGENTFIKGKAEHLDEAHNQLEISRKAEASARQAVEAGRYGAQRWVDLHSEKAERWQMAIDRLTNASIPDGTLITLPAVARPQTRAALSAAIRESEISRWQLHAHDNDDNMADPALEDLWRSSEPF